MVLAKDLDGRQADLTARIEAAKRRLAEENRMEWAEIGNLLEGMSVELQELNESDHDKRAGTYDRLTGELSAIHARLETKPGPS